MVHAQNKSQTKFRASVLEFGDMRYTGSALQHLMLILRKNEIPI